MASTRSARRLQASLDAVVEMRQSVARTTVPLDVSVVIPTYQSAGTIVEAVRAALCQEGSCSHEVIVVDDGSTDDTEQAMQRVLIKNDPRLVYLRLDRNRGRAAARNAGIAAARGDVIAFTDADCLVNSGWVAAGLGEFTDKRIGIVQGPTLPPPGQPRPFFNHFIEIDHFDGTFSTCNVFYRRQALLDVDGFDPDVVYWEDLDLGWRVRRQGWEASFASGALVHHQVLPLSPWRWLCWPLHYRYMPAKVTRYPEYRRYLFLGVWVSWFHLLFDLALLSLPLALLVRRGFVVLSLPYLVAFPGRHGLAGRWPVLKVLSHLAWDAWSFGVLAVSSLRHRSPVL